MSAAKVRGSAGARIDIPVQGMTCAACQASVQKALQRQPGVLDAAVNLMMKSAAVTYDPAVTRPEALVEAIRDTGYEAELPLPDVTAFAGQEASDRADAEEFRSLRRKAIASGAAGVLAMIVSMPLMAAGVHRGPVGDPFMRWAMESLTPALRAVLPGLYRIAAAVLSYTLLVLTAVVMVWAGRHFYVRAWQALRASLGGHEHARRGGHGRGVRLLRGRDARARRSSLSHGVAPDLYYEPVIIIIALVLTGNALEARAKRHTSTALRALVELQPQTRARGARGRGARRAGGAGGARRRTSSCARASAFPWTARSLAGASAVDESMLTGESMPVEKHGRRSRDRRDDQSHRRLPLPRDHARRGQRARAHRAAHARCAERRARRSRRSRIA